MAKQKITVQTTVKAPVDKVWKSWSNPADITQWCNASDDWHAPKAENDLRTGGKFKTTMAARDGSASFDWEGVYTTVEDNRRIEYRMDDGRTVQVSFEERGGETAITETFDAESVHPIDVQRDGWQAILDHFKNHVEKRS